MPNSLQTLVQSLVDKLVNPLIALMFAIGFVIFLYGVVEFMWGLSQESDKREDGKRHMLYGVIGMFIMVAGYALVALIRSTVCGLSGASGGPAC